MSDPNDWRAEQVAPQKPLSTWPPTPAVHGFARCPVCGTWRAPKQLGPFREPGSDEGAAPVMRCLQLDFCERQRKEISK